MNSIDLNTEMAQIRETAQKMANAMGFEAGPRCCAALSAGYVLSFALIIIGLASGSFSAAGIGYTTIGFAGAIFAADLAAGNLKERKIQVILCAFMEELNTNLLCL